jgi:uncharacterized membrane protein YqjE
MSHPDGSDAGMGQAVQDITDRVSLLVREEIELAKAEVSTKISKLIKGAVVGAAAGIFVVIGLLFLLIGAAYLFFDYVFDELSFGFFIVAGILFLLGALAGWIAARAFKAGAPPAPVMAIEEGRKIKETLTSPGAAAEAERAGRDVQLHPSKQTEATR